MLQSKITLYADESWLSLLDRCDGYYKRPRHSDGSWAGPLVGYAGKYDAGDGKQLTYVGFEYANFAKIEQHGNALRRVANHLNVLILGDDRISELDGFVGMPMGGLKLSGALAFVSGIDDIYPEIVVDELKTATSRQKSHLEFGRHTPVKGQSYIIVEDVCNNFSTTQKGISLIEHYGARVVGIACFLNRSPLYQGSYPYQGRSIPILALVERAIPEYRQDDPVVANDVQIGNVILKPKEEWHLLKDAMTSFP